MEKRENVGTVRCGEVEFYGLLSVTLLLIKYGSYTTCACMVYSYKPRSKVGYVQSFFNICHW